MSEKFNYVICTTQRSGSTMVCGDIESLGVAGNPKEYFHLSHVEKVKEKDKFTSASYKKLMDEAKTDNGVIGLKIMADSVKFAGKCIESSHEQWANGTPVKTFFEYMKQDYKFIFLQRRSTVEQAVSHYVAKKTKKYHSYQIKKSDSYNEDVEFDFDEIDQEVKKIKFDNHQWHEWFKKFDIEPMKLFYEDCARDIGYLKDILELIGVNDDTTLSGDRKIKKIANSMSEKFVAEYKSIKNQAI